MDRGDWRGNLLTTSSALALVVGMGGTAWAQCFSQNTAPVTNTVSNNCITFFDGAAHTGDITNNNTLTGVVPYPPANPGTATGISVVKSGTLLNGNIINNGTISAQNAGINIGEGATTSRRQVSQRLSSAASPSHWLSGGCCWDAEPQITGKYLLS